jgi:hypothetical protein
LVSIGIADAGFHGSLCLLGWLVLRRLGRLRLGRGRLIHNPSILWRTFRQRSWPS